MEKKLNPEDLPNEAKIKMLSDFVDGAIADLWKKENMEFVLIVSEKGKKENLVGGTMPLKKLITIIIVLANRLFISILPDKERAKVEEILHIIFTTMEKEEKSHTIH